MWKHLSLLLLTSCAGMAPTTAVDTQEFIFSQADGRSFTLVLPADWSPQVEGGFLRITPRNRVLAMDVIMIRPRVQPTVAGLERVQLARRLSSTSRSAHYDLWVEAGRQELLSANHSLDLIKMGPQTWLRPNDFRLLLEH